MFDVNITRFIMNGKGGFCYVWFAGAALAMYHCAKPERKPSGQGAADRSHYPFDLYRYHGAHQYSFPVCSSPVVLVVHAGYAGLAYLLTYIFKD